MLLILVDQETERIKYALDFIFTERSVPYRLTTSAAEYMSDTEGMRFNYSSNETVGGYTIRPAFLMQDRSLSIQKTTKGKIGKIECISFDNVTDPVASVFYILTRYEEYNPDKSDVHGRFPFNASVLKEFEWVETAVCDRWSRQIIEAIDPDLYIDVVLHTSLVKGKGAIIPTFDIDNTFAYRYKRGGRKILSFFRDLFNMDWERIRERRSVNSGKTKDPYDTFDRIREIAENFPDTRLFWLTASNGEKDRNLSLKSPEHKKLIKSLAKEIKLGLHPSYASFRKKGEILSEKKLLEVVSETEIDSSRQHFLRFRLPHTFEELLESGIRHEFSMGFAEHIGFRSGTARAHAWFNLNSNKRTELMIHPFVYMDGTLREYMNLSIGESKEKIRELFLEVKEQGGEFIFIWHNETIGDYKNWKGWNEVLNYTLNLENE